VTVESDELIEMAVEISLGKTEPPSWYNREQRDAWEELVREIREIEAKGGSVDLPSEIP
jgi:hypothetical protein